MAVDKKTVARIAALARIRVREDEQERLAGELSKIIGWVEQLDEVDTKGIAPMASCVDTKLRRREDRVTDGGIPDKVLANAPESVDGFFVVPKVVE
jgi:aspartyl-tRNA(Asn)/glutamyl-tRNA(Gln) amidotransferase subunit C